MEHRRSPTAYNFDTDIEFPSLGAEMENITEGQKNRQKEAESSGDFSHFSFISRIPVKALVLGLLVVQNSALAICMRYSRMRCYLCLDCNIVRMACPSSDYKSSIFLNIDTLHLGSISLHLA